MKENFIIIALGSNMGDRSANLSGGIKALQDFVNISKISPFYSSRAVLSNGAPAEWDKQFHNCVLAGFTELEPLPLLKECEKIENQFGKKQKGTDAPRFLDIDIIAYGDQIIESEKLNIPHKLMHERSFVIFPLLDILPDWKHPILAKKTIEMSLLLNKNGLERL